MKKLLPILFLFISSFSFINASDNKSYSKEQLNGTWFFEKVTAEEVKTTNDTVTNMIKDDILKAESVSEIKSITFKSKNDRAEIVFNDEDIKEIGVFDIEGDTLIIRLINEDDDEAEDFFEGRISLSNNTLILYDDNTEYFQEEMLEYAPDDEVFRVIEAMHFSKK